MAFELPKLVDLTDDQLTILNAAYDKNMIVGGPPGTGKSVLAIYRAADLSNKRRKTLLLVYNRPLKFYISTAVDSLHITTEVSTYHAWLNEMYKNVIQKNAPKWNFDWDFNAVCEDFKRLGTIYDDIIIDEAQDFPIELIKALTYVGKHISCFMDVKQRIFSSRHASYADIATTLGIRTMYTLSDNFRNTEEIFNFAKLYNSEIDDDILTMRNGEKPLFAKVNSLDQVYETIQNIVDNNPARTIGVFTNYGKQEEVSDSIRKLVGSKVSVRAYDGNSANSNLWKINFDNNGVFVLSTGTMKGLEFDVVVIPRVDGLKRKKDKELDSNTFYVAATRASEDLYCFYETDQQSSSYIDVFGPLNLARDLVDWEDLTQ